MSGLFNMWNTKLSRGPGYVYLAQCGPLFKIGSSVNPKRRLPDMRNEQTYIIGGWLRQGYKVVHLHSIPVENMQAAERRLLNLFVSQRYRGEWFTLEMDQVNWICSLQSL
jgi:hypothetical protein